MERVGPSESLVACNSIKPSSERAPKKNYHLDSSINDVRKKLK